jgi:hypothetical protein
MSKLFDMRQALAARIIAADIGWTEETVIIKRQTDLWNDVATAMAAAANNAVLHIGIAEGSAREGFGGLMTDLTLTLTVLCSPVTAPTGATPEEDLWEALVRFVHGLRLEERDHCQLEFRYKSFAESDMEADGGTRYLARQTIFTKALYLGA